MTKLLGRESLITQNLLRINARVGPVMISKRQSPKNAT
jgi:hypothetical protein